MSLIIKFDEYDLEECNPTSSADYNSFIFIFQETIPDQLANLLRIMIENLKFKIMVEVGTHQ